MDSVMMGQRVEHEGTGAGGKITSFTIRLPFDDRPWARVEFDDGLVCVVPADMLRPVDTLTLTSAVGDVVCLDELATAFTLSYRGTLVGRAQNDYGTITLELWQPTSAVNGPVVSMRWCDDALPSGAGWESI